MNLQNAQVYDLEVYPNCFLMIAQPLYGDQEMVWEISEYRNDRPYLMEYFNWLHNTQTPMIGFNVEGYDYQLCHMIYCNPEAGFEQLYAKSQSIIESNDRFSGMIWPRDRFAPQIDLYKIHHFDNIAKRQSLKGLEFNMRSPNVRETSVPFGTWLTQQQIDHEVIPYGKTDVGETKRFTGYSMGAIEFRLGLIEKFGVDALSWNDTKIGEKMLEDRLGHDVCYTRVNGRREKRQTIRHQIVLNDIIFPYIKFSNPEFNRVLDFMKAQVLTPDEFSESKNIKTKGVFTDLHASVAGLTFHFGTGGVHASVETAKFTATEEWPIIDIDVEGLYPNIAIKNRLAPEHLGEAFIAEYAKIPAERKLHAKGTYMNAALKLAANGAWGKSNSPYSVFFDSQYAMTIPINGQLMICMLAERLAEVPTIKLIQANTDGITYQVHHDYVPMAKTIEDEWQAYTLLVLEYAEYSHMWIRDVNNYVARSMDGKLKLKGAYWTPDADPEKYADSISNASPPAWHKDLSAPIIARAAVAAMVDNIPPEIFIWGHTDPFDFMLRAKVDRSSKLMLGDRQIQSVSRYYLAKDGEPLIKVSPPVAGGVIGQFKRANGVTKAEYERVMRETGGQWDERVCTKNKSVYQERRTNLQAGFKVAECNLASEFDFNRLDRDWYINEAKKLII